MTLLRLFPWTVRHDLSLAFCQMEERKGEGTMDNDEQTLAF